MTRQIPLWVRSVLSSLLLPALYLMVSPPLVAVAQTGQEAPAAASLEEVFAAIGVDQTVADLVVVVDTSASMEEDDRYDRVLEALRPFLQALSPTEYLGLLTFDEEPTLQYAGPIGQPPDRAVDLLPDDATGTSTDIGQALDRALDEFVRPDPSDAAVLVFITDGLHDPPTDSQYVDPTGPAWDELASRGQALADSRAVASYALALGGDTDAGLVSEVLPDTLVVDLPPDQIAPFLQRVKDDVRLTKARQLLASDLDGTVEVSWAGAFDQLDLSTGRARVELTLTSTFDQIPVTISELGASAEGIGDVTLEGLPETVVLAPGESRTLDVDLNFSAVGGFGFGRNEVVREGQLRLVCQVSSPWSEVVTGQLGLEFDPRCAGATAAIRATGFEGWSWLSLGGLLALVLLVLGAIWYWRLARQPLLKGALLATVPGQPQARGRLTGRKSVIGRNKGSVLPKLSGRGEVRGRRVARRGKRRGFDLELLIRYSADGKTMRDGVCKPNGSTVVDGVTFTYQPSGRSSERS